MSENEPASPQNPIVPDLYLLVEVRSLPWPDGSLQLFRQDTASFDTAWIPQTARDWHQYAMGYQTAYERLFETWEKVSFRPDTLIYPMVFLCRHYIELRLKELTQMCLSLLEISEDWKLNHNIEVLWKRVRPRIRAIWPDDPEDDLNHVEALILEFATIDPTSFAFRYPVDKEGEKQLKTIQRLDVANLKKAMSQLSSFLDAVCQGASVYLENRGGL